MSISRQKLIVYIVLIMAAFAVYWQVHSFDFINFDDQAYIEDNGYIQSGITGKQISWALSSRYFYLWTPLTWISFMFDHQLYGLKAGGYHVTNLILHILSTLLLFWLFNRMTSEIWKSAFVAALFALHPLHVESVAWVSERKDVLCALFWMITLCLYVYYTEKPVIKRYLCVLFSFILAIMSKPMVVTLPVVMILLDFWPLKRFESKKSNLILWQLKEKTPFFILSAVLSVITLYSPDIHIKSFPLSARIANAPIAFVRYLEKTFWPHDMAIFYPFPAHIPIWQAIGASLLILAVTAYVMVMIKRLPFLFMGWSWYFITLLPVNGIIQIQPYAMADHYHYLPSIGITVMIAWGIPSLFKREDTTKKILFPAGVTALAILMFLSCNQCGYWKNSITLFNHALRVTKDNYIAHHGLGLALSDQGKTEEALNHYNKTISIDPEFASAYSNRGIIYGGLGKHQLAMDDFNKAISLKKNYAEAYYNKAVTYASMDQYLPAIENYSQAITIKQDYAYAYNNRGAVYLQQGNYKLGCKDAQKGCELGKCKVLEWAMSNRLCQ